ncbi:hypothetical protein GCG54_00014690 [Colletotrichum gloeosporioides]|uniref:Aminoglycoside phosphotransferase domain-containing protein n=1 Tax=Colletotrichum gloeosporioides TaxID=474922 RepID=A0A8H4CCJ4_COLGL|nr:uncharacterized protein GCG54_00014690 [Colletotrichum gloeosporioides]KAF3801476.1 hypothetical protein GCG54_00014690 [Colletotrichum gloeosporioides]
MNSAVSAIRTFQSVHLQDDNVLQEHNTDGDSTPSSKRRFGGPETGYHSSIRPTLEILLYPEAKELFICQITEGSGELAITTTDDDLGGDEFSLADLNELNDNIVLCHNDLEPRNVRNNGSDEGGSPWYEVAAIIDWEMPGVFPFAYDFGIKDPYLGSNNLFFSWYRLFKEKTAALVPAGGVQDKLIKALKVIFKSNDKAVPENAGTRSGWVRMEDAGEIPPLTKDEEEKLEDEVLGELGYV